MKEIFTISGISSSVRKDGDIDVKVHLTTQVSPAYAGTLLEKLTPLAHRFVVARLENQQQELINTETGEVS
jgi:hypothetical protein